jgi:hypothetical protein
MGEVLLLRVGKRERKRTTGGGELGADTGFEGGKAEDFEEHAGGGRNGIDIHARVAKASLLVFIKKSISVLLLDVFENSVLCRIYIWAQPSQSAQEQPFRALFIPSQKF